MASHVLSSKDQSQKLSHRKIESSCQKERTINVLCETLKQLRGAIQNKHCGMLKKAVQFLHKNATPGTTVWTQDLVDFFVWDVIDHLHYSPGLALRDFHLFLHLKKQYLGGKLYGNNEQVKVTKSKWIKNQEAEFY